MIKHVWGKMGWRKLIHFLTAELFRLLNFSQAFRLSNYGIEQGSANFFCQGPDGKYFRPCGSNGLHYNKLILLLWQQSCCKTLDNMQCVWLCSNKTLFIKTSKGQDSAFRPWCSNPWSRINKMYWTTEPFIHSSMHVLAIFYGTKLSVLQSGRSLVHDCFPDIYKGTWNTENSQPKLTE